MKTIISFFKQDHNRFIALLIIFGAFIRLIQLGNHPAGLNQEEAALGYDIWALIHYGIDRNNIPWPIHFISWGSGQNALLGYIALPFIWLFDLSTFSLRLPNALIGIASFIAAYGIGCRLLDKRFGTLLLLLTIISPWHLMISRWSLEANIYPSIVLVAFYFLLRASEHKKFLFFFTALLALSLYAYETSYAFTPLFLLGFVVFAFRTKQFSLKPVTISVLIFLIIATPIIIFILINAFSLPEIITPYFSIPRYTGNPQLLSITALPASTILNTLLKNIADLILLIFGSQKDILRLTTLDYAGIIFPVTIPFTLIGIYTACKNWIIQRNNIGWSMLLCWVVAGFLTSLITTPNMTRINILAYPIIIFTAYGLYLTSTQWSTFYRLALSMILIFFSIFIIYYFTGYHTETQEEFHYGLGNAIIEAQEKCNPNDTILVLTRDSAAYIQALFFTEADPNQYHTTRIFEKIKVPFQVVRSYSNYKFSTNQSDFVLPNISVVESYRLADIDTTHYYVKLLHNYTLLLKKSEYPPFKLQKSETPYFHIYPTSISYQNMLTIHTNQNIGQIKVTLFSPYIKKRRRITLSPFQTGVYQLPIDSLYPGYNRLNFFTFDSTAKKRIRHTKELFNKNHGTTLPLSFSSLNGTQDWRILVDNLAVNRSAITVNNKIYSFGMGTHGTSRYAFTPPNNADSLFVAFGMSDEKTCGDGVSVSIVGGTTTLYHHSSVRRGKLYTTKVAVPKVDSLFLISKNKINSRCDHLNWIYPYFSIQQ
ncbi:MAG: NPCBM/NEW2 domain-containing protein [Fibrobacterales bacterium]